MIIPVKTSAGGYDIVLERGALDNLDKYLPAGKKTLIVTDSGVPAEYAEKLKNHCADAEIVVIEQGESSKNIDNFVYLLSALVSGGYTRTDRVVAVGGGVVGDLAGFAAASFMRGIEFINIPTTLLSQVDSSIGGKTAVDFMGIKNIVGAFYQPSKVIIDHNTLETLPKRQISNGLAEALKMSLTNDKELFEIFENTDPFANLDVICERAIMIKRDVVESDEKEKGLRRVLNFGHTLAHAVESVNEMQGLLHGECVAIGMVPMCSEKVRARLLPVLKKLSLPTELRGDSDALVSACLHDKKMSGSDITVVFVGEVGSFEFRKIPASELKNIIGSVNVR